MNHNRGYTIETLRVAVSWKIPPSRIRNTQKTICKIRVYHLDIKCTSRPHKTTTIEPKNTMNREKNHFKLSVISIQRKLASNCKCCTQKAIIQAIISTDQKAILE